MCSTRSRRFCEAFRQNAHHFGVRRFGEVDGGAPLAEHLRQRADVIGVFVGDDDAVEPVDLAPDRGEAPQRFFFAEARVHQQAGLLRFEQRAVARTARSQYRDAQTDKFPRRTGPQNAQAHRIMTKCGAGVNEANAMTVREFTVKSFRRDASNVF